MRPRRASSWPTGAADVERFHAALRRRSPRQGRFERTLRAAIRAWCLVVDWRIEVTGVSRLPVVHGEVPGAGCVVAVAPHRAWVEPFLLAAAWPRDAARLVWLADGRTVTRSWWRRTLLPRVGVIPIQGGIRGPRTYADLAAAALRAGAALAVFPETGPPSAPHRTRRIAPGFAYIALRAGAPIVPVAVAGTHHIVRGSHFSVDVLDALDGGPAVPDPFARGSRDLAHDVVARYAAAIDEVLPGRTAEADARRPERDRWAWLTRLFG